MTTMFESPVECTPDSVDLIRTWVPHIAMSLFFLSFGSQKFSDAMWVRIFEQIGFGDWLVGAWIFFLNSPGSALFPAIILALLIALGLRTRRA